jgi:D-psicose/D-tagatose/L-ribulose 3-epimerase
MIPWEEFFSVLNKIGYNGSLSIEAFDPNYSGYNNVCAMWRKLAGSGEEIAIRGLENLTAIARNTKQKAERT